MNLRKVNVPDRRPGKCAFCLESASEKGFVDSGREWKNWGKGYICDHCVEECAQTLGHIPNREALDAFEQVEQLKARISQLEAENTELEQQVDKLSNDVVDIIRTRIESSQKEPVGERKDTAVKKAPAKKPVTKKPVAKKVEEKESE